MMTRCMLVMVQVLQDKTLTFATTFTHQCRPSGWLLAAPQYRSLIRRDPNPAFVPHTMVSQRSFLGRSSEVCWSVRTTKRFPLADIFPHKLSNHGCSNCINDTCRRHRTVDRAISCVSCSGCGSRQLVPMTKATRVDHVTWERWD
jgi:hypothetical protein